MDPVETETESERQSAVLVMSVVMIGSVVGIWVFADDIWITEEPVITSGPTEAGVQPVTDYDVVPVFDGEYHKLVMNRIRQAEESIVVAQYVIRSHRLNAEFPSKAPKDPVYELLEALIKRNEDGIDVTVYLSNPETGDNQSTRFNRRVGRFLSENGVDADYVDDDVDLHDKLVLIDGDEVIQGSHNWTPSGVSSNREMSWWMKAVDADQTWTWERYQKGLVGQP